MKDWLKMWPISCDQMQIRCDHMQTWCNHMQTWWLIKCNLILGFDQPSHPSHRSKCWTRWLEPGMFWATLCHPPRMDSGWPQLKSMWRLDFLIYNMIKVWYGLKYDFLRARPSLELDQPHQLRRTLQQKQLFTISQLSWAGEFFLNLQIKVTSLR